MLFRRPSYRCAEDIGTWLSILEGLGTLCVISNCGVLGITSSSLERYDVVSSGDDSSKTTQILTAAAAEHIVLFIRVHATLDLMHVVLSMTHK